MWGFVIGFSSVSAEGFGYIVVSKHEKSGYFNVKFSDYTIYHYHKSHIKTGKIKNRNMRSVYGVGYIGFGIHTSRNNPNYGRWLSMIRRCYTSDFPIYSDCTVHESWHNFQNYAEYMCKYQNLLNEGFDVDKDLFSENGKVYGPDTCELLPKRLNCAISNNWADNGIPNGLKLCNQKDEKYYVMCVDKNEESVYLGSYHCKERAFSVYREFKLKTVRELCKIYKDKLSQKAYLKLTTEWDVKKWYF